MNVRFWGTRGNISTPGREFLKYGGNTPCLEIFDKDGYVILDAGYGLVGLGNAILRGGGIYGAKDIHIFLTHMHWDHIQGIPFFIPIFLNTHRIHFYGNKKFKTPLKEILDQQFSLNYSPIGSIEKLPSEITYTELAAGENVDCCGFNINPFEVPHRHSSFGYRVKNHSKTVIYTGDCEFMRKRITSFRKEITGADMIIHDSNFIDDDMPSYRNWGHNSADAAIENAIKAGIQTFVLSHYSHYFSDEIIDVEVAKIKKKYKGKIDIIASHEGMILPV